jgi:hypothetical protein
MLISNAMSGMPRGWLLIFALLESVLIVAWLGAVTMNITLNSLQPEDTIRARCFGVFTSTALFLMIVCPFFLSALRWVALLGWFLGFSAFLFAGVWFGR